MEVPAQHCPVHPQTNHPAPGWAAAANGGGLKAWYCARVTLSRERCPRLQETTGNIPLQPVPRLHHPRPRPPHTHHT